MATQHGNNLTSIKEKNRALALQLIATGQAVSRVELARKMLLTKTTLGNIVSELIAKGIVSESRLPEAEVEAETALGRRPITLDLAPTSPLIAGMLIKRNILSVILADLKGVVVDQADYEYETIDAQSLTDRLLYLYDQLSDRQSRPIVAIGISSPGPVDTTRQMIMAPINFWGIRNLPISSIIQEKTGLPTFLIHDCSAGALAEKIYGARAGQLDNFLYLHIMNGIGAGYVLRGRVYGGDLGQSGEIGHMSINFGGPKCSCGNTGCLELYANIHQMNAQIRSLQNSVKVPSILPVGKGFYRWREIMNAAAASDFYALTAVETFCDYLALALRNVVNLLDIHTILMGYHAPENSAILEDILRAKLSESGTDPLPVAIERSSFGQNAPLIGSVAVVANKIFNGSLTI